jgi:hypothetical protein
MTLRLPIDLREAVTEESRVKGDLAKIVLFALSHVEREKVDIMQTRKAGMELSNPQLLHVGAEARLKLKEWAEAEGVSVNAIVVSVLEEFFKRLKKSKALREELRLEIRAHRGFMPFRIQRTSQAMGQSAGFSEEASLSQPARSVEGRKPRPVIRFPVPHDKRG